MTIDSGPVAGGRDLDLPGAGVRLRGTLWRGPGAPVVLCHGLASTRRFWNLVAPDLLPRTVLAVDARGHGESERPPSRYGIEDVVADLATALDAVGISRAVVAGHSWGGNLALAFAARHPERTLAAVAIDGGFTRPGGEPREDVRRRLEPPRLAVPPDELPAMLRSGPLAPYWSPDHERALLPIFAIGPDGLARARLPFDAHMQIVDAILDFRPDDVLPQIRCPAWLVACEPIAPPGEADGSVEWAERKVEGLRLAGSLLSRPRLLRWAGAVHDVPLQWPRLVSGVIAAASDEVLPRVADAVR